MIAAEKPPSAVEQFSRFFNAKSTYFIGFVGVSGGSWGSCSFLEPAGAFSDLLGLSGTSSSFLDFPEASCGFLGAC